MKKLALLLFLLNVLFLNAQSNSFKYYHDHVQEAYRQDSLGNFDVAVQHMDSAFILFEYYPYDYFNAFTFAFKASNLQKAQYFLIEGTKKGLDTDGWFSDYLDQFLGLSEGRTYLFQKDSLMQIHLKTIDTVSLNTLLELMELDQKERYVNPDSREMFLQDSLNFEALILLSKTRGFPTFPTAGYGCNYAHLLLWHHRGPEYPNSEQWQEIIPLIETRITEGLLDPDFFEMFEKFNLENKF